MDCTIGFILETYPKVTKTFTYVSSWKFCIFWFYIEVYD